MNNEFRLMAFATALASVWISASPSAITAAAAASDRDLCDVKTLAKSGIQGLKVYSPDATQYVVNRKDANGVAQIYIAASGSSELTCLTCVERPGGPGPGRFKMQPHWHPSGRWIFMAVERETYAVPPVFHGYRDWIEGQLQNGLWTNMYAVSPDGLDWHQLTDFIEAPGMANGFTGPAFTPDGKKVVWSQIVDGNVLMYWPFGRWELTMADFSEMNGSPVLENLINITPPGMSWNEPGNFAPDNESLVLSGSTEVDAQGMDQYILNVRTGALVNLTRSPTVWDEHGVFSPSGEKIIFMSAYPYRDDPSSSNALTIRTEYMQMDRNGGALTQLTHFFEWGYPEFSPFNGIAASAAWQPDGQSVSLRRLIFPEYEDWSLEFSGACGLGKPRGTVR